MSPQKSELTQNVNVFVDLKLKDQENVKIGCVYCPPWTADEEYIVDLQKALDEIDPHHKNNIWLGARRLQRPKYRLVRHDEYAEQLKHTVSRHTD